MFVNKKKQSKVMQFKKKKKSFLSHHLYSQHFYNCVSCLSKSKGRQDEQALPVLILFSF